MFSKAISKYYFHINMGNANCCSTSKPPQVSSKDEEYIDTPDEAPKGVSVHCISTSLLEEVQQMNDTLEHIQVYYSKKSK